jgi:GPH family glycoside/pentoside/hexuronide:cation symporter
MLAGLGLVLTGTMAGFWALDPRWPWLLYVTGAVSFLGMQGCWLLVSSMVADICDEVELQTGRRREGMFSAVIGFALKAAQGITFGIGGYLATWAGFDAQAVAAHGVDATTAGRMKLFLVGFQALGLALAMVAMAFYPISRLSAAETRRRLAEREGNRDRPKENQH